MALELAGLKNYGRVAVEMVAWGHRYLIGRWLLALLVDQPSAVEREPEMRPWKVTAVPLACCDNLVMFLTFCSGQRQLKPGLFLGSDFTFWALLSPERPEAEKSQGPYITRVYRGRCMRDGSEVIVKQNVIGGDSTGRGLNGINTIINQLKQEYVVDPLGYFEDFINSREMYIVIGKAPGRKLVDYLKEIGPVSVETFVCLMEALRDIAYNNILPISDLGHHGRVLRLVFSEAVHAQAVKYLIDKRIRQLVEQDKSEEFIEREVEKMKKKFQEIYLACPRFVGVKPH